VRHEDFSDAALVLVGHGTTLNAGSAVPAFQHAAELRRRGLFSTVREAFWKQEPRVGDVLATVTEGRVFIAPLLISEGYFGQEVLPRALGFEPARGGWGVLHRGDQLLFYCRPVGTHDRMTEVLLARAREVVEAHPFPRAPKPQNTALFIAGHGTERNENSRQPVERQVELIRKRELYASVQGVFMEEAPRIAGCWAGAESRNLVVVPFFISEGLHVKEDIPVLLGTPERIARERLANGRPAWRNPSEREGKLVWYSESVGTHPAVVDVILERVREAAQRG
jgi:sirohydrochlorin cobaltochelatase